MKVIVDAVLATPYASRLPVETLRRDLRDKFPGTGIDVIGRGIMHAKTEAIGFTGFPYRVGEAGCEPFGMCAKAVDLANLLDGKRAVPVVYSLYVDRDLSVTMERWPPKGSAGRLVFFNREANIETMGNLLLEIML